MSESLRNVGMYIHIPFRIYKHNIRDVISYFNKDFYIDSYFEYLKKELELRKDDKLLIDSVYIGGGDPSSIDSDYITDILDYIYANYNVKKDCEKTIELDPMTPDIRIKRYIEHGINRFSIKAFTFDKNSLEDLSMFHEGQDTLSLIKNIRRRGCDNINVDMYFSYSGQTIDNLVSDINILEKNKIPHISYYSYKSDEEILAERELVEIDDMEFLESISNLLEKKGYHHYELNHFAKKGYESFHSSKYWNLDDYIGVGISSAGLLYNHLYNNEEEFENYFEKIENKELPLMKNEVLTNEELEKYYIINKLGTQEGLNIDYFNNRFKNNFIEKYGATVEKFIERNILEKFGDEIRFSKHGLYYSSTFFKEII